MNTFDPKILGTPENKRRLYAVGMKWVLGCLFAMGALFTQLAHGTPSTTLDLAGTWGFTPQGSAATTIQVPGGGWYKQGFTTISEADYERSITVPSVTPGQVTKLEIGAVNYQADVYINNVLVGSNVTSFTSSTFDLSSAVTPGGTYTLRIHVKGRKAFMVNGRSLVPNAAGWSPNTAQGIFRSIRLAVYAPIYIEDVFVRTQVGTQQLFYDIWVRNSTSQSQSMTLGGSLSPWNQAGWNYPTIPATSFTAAANTTTKVTVGPVAWNLGTSSYWWPNVPYVANYRAQLHNLLVSLKQGANTMDQTSIRFGFREVTQGSDGTNTCYFLNGIRVNFRGDSLQGANYDSINYGGGRGDAYSTLPGFLPGPNGWPIVVDHYQRLNYNFVRLHQEPVTPYMLDVCDEMGLMLMDETAIRGSNKDQDFVQGKTNMVNHLKALFTQNRNHASIVRQSLSNEPDLIGDSALTDPQAFQVELYNAAVEVDGTRPLSIDAYSQAFLPQMKYPNFSIYGHYAKGIDGDVFTDEVWARTDRPYGQGEYIWRKDNTKRGFAWFGTSAMPMRFKGASDIRPYTLLSAWVSLVPGVNTTEVTLEQGGNPLFGENNMPDPWSNPIFKRVQAGFHPVLVADAEYWASNRLSNLDGAWPVNVPTLPPGRTAKRKLNIFNDTFQETSVSVRWELRKDSVAGQLLAANTFPQTVPLGYARQVPIEVPVPNLADGTKLFLVLTASKNGVEVFRENSQQFQVMNVVQLKGGTPFGSSPPYKAGNEFDKATDGNVDTYFDYMYADGGETGIDLGVGGECPISLIQFWPRTGNENRMIGGVFEGSMDGTTYETLATVTTAPNSQQQILVTNPNAYRYLRYRGPNGSYGNIAEMAFFVRGYNQLTGTSFGAGPAYKPGFEFEKAMDGNPNTFYDYAYANGGYTGVDLGAGILSPVSLIQFSPRVGYTNRMVGGVFEGSVDGVTYSTLATVTTTPVANQQISVTNPNFYRYLRYRGPDGSYGNIAEMAFFVKGYSKLSGTPFGTSPSYNAGYEFDKATDGDPDTFFDYLYPNGGITGIDLGAGNARRVAFIQYSARKTFPARMTGGIFEGSVDGTTYQTLATLTASTAVDRRVVVTDPTIYRYLRYRGPNGSYGNIAEMEFISYDLPPLNAPALMAAQSTSSGVTLSWKQADGMTYRIKRASSEAGPFETVADTVAGGTFTDSSGTSGNFYQVYPLSDGTEGLPAEASIGSLSTLAQWRLMNFGTTNAEGDAADDADPDHDQQTNLSEFIAGTNPLDARSALKFSSSRVEGTDMVLSFPTVRNKVYRLMQSIDLSSGVWTQVGSDIVGDGSDMEMRDTDAVNEPKAFYRLQVSE